MQTIDSIRQLWGRQTRVRDYLDRLAVDPPQVLILEGGAADERSALAVYWALALNCPQKSPCLQCLACVQIIDRKHRDLFYFDGAAESIKIGEIRELRGALGEPPRGAGRRVVVLAEAQFLTNEAANALLKSLEEPNPWTRFIMFAPQRERLLPTLVSRGWVLTLGWPAAARQVSADPEENARIDGWLESLAGFLASGKGWMERTVEKGAVDKKLANSVILRCQQELVDALTGHPQTNLATLWRRDLSLTHLRRLDVALGYAMDLVAANVNAALVLDWLATRMYEWRGGGGA